MREYKIDDVTFRVKQDNDCVFCSHCTDIFWDYTHGIYALICELEREEVNSLIHTCEEFEED